MTKYHRPCTLWGRTFDAGGLMLTLESIKPGNITKEWVIEKLYTLTNALNAPVRATDAVLAELKTRPYDLQHKVEVQLKTELGEIAWFPVHYSQYDGNHYSYRVASVEKTGYKFNIQDFHFIRATNAAALEYLLQFTTEGVKKDA